MNALNVTAPDGVTINQDLSASVGDLKLTFSGATKTSALTLAADVDIYGQVNTVMDSNSGTLGCSKIGGGAPPLHSIQ